MEPLECPCTVGRVKIVSLPLISYFESNYQKCVCSDKMHIHTPVDEAHLIVNGKVFKSTYKSCV